MECIIKWITHPDMDKTHTIQYIAKHTNMNLSPRIGFELYFEI